MTQTVVAERAEAPRRATRPSPPGDGSRLGAAFKHGDVFTRGSAVVMGLGNLARRQYAKGAMFLIVEIGFIYLLVTQGLGKLAGLGNLGPVFAGAAARLAPDGFLLFTTEAKAGEGFELGPKRRWRHSEAYLRQCAEKAGLEVAGLVAATPRHEAGQPVEGFAVALRR